jgi:hypothetical protein
MDSQFDGVLLHVLVPVLRVSNDIPVDDTPSPIAVVGPEDEPFFVRDVAVRRKCGELLLILSTDDNAMIGKCCPSI